MSSTVNRIRRSHLLPFTLLCLLCFILFGIDATVAQPRSNAAAAERTYLNLVLDLETPVLTEPQRGGFFTPELRHAATSDFIAALRLCQAFPSLSFTVNFPASALSGIDQYLSRLSRFIDLKTETVDAAGFLKQSSGQSDVWLDLLLKPSNRLTAREADMLTNGSGKQVWNAFSVSEATLRRFPQYRALLPADMNVGSITGSVPQRLISVQDLTKIKFFFAITHFDKAFLRGNVVLPSVDARGETASVAVDLSDYFTYDDHGTPLDDGDDEFILAKPIGEDDCQRLVIETYKVLQSLKPLARSLAAGRAAGNAPSPSKKRPAQSKQRDSRRNIASVPAGMIEFAASSIQPVMLPLLCNNELAKPASGRQVSARFVYPQDAAQQLVRGSNQLASMFASPVAASPSQKENAASMTTETRLRGAMLHEGGLSAEALTAVADAGLQWTMTGSAVLALSLGKPETALSAKDVATLYTAKDARGRSLAVAFADGRMRSEIKTGFVLRSAAENISRVLEFIKLPPAGAFVTIVLPMNGHWLKSDKDFQGRRFLEGLCSEIAAMNEPQAGIITATPTEYQQGHAARNLAPHKALPVIEKLAAGTYDGTGFERWAGDDEETRAWSYLAAVRGDFDAAGLAPPVFTDAGTNADTSRAARLQAAWRRLYLAEHAGWFLQYGNEQSNPLADDLDLAFRSLLSSINQLLIDAGYAVVRRTFPPVVKLSERPPLRDLTASRLAIDGLLSEQEWFETAGTFINPESQSGAEGAVRRCYYGLDDQNLFLALDGGADLESLLQDSLFSIRLTLRYEKNRVSILELRGTTLKTLPLPVAVSGSVIEMRLPFALLNNFTAESQFIEEQSAPTGVQLGKIYERKMPLGMAIETGTERRRGRMPKEGFYPLEEDRMNTMFVTFEVDASVEPNIDAITIAGDRPELGNGTPGTVRLYDNGTSGDRKSNDRVWTRTFRFKRGDEIQYKYFNSTTPAPAPEFEGTRGVRVEPDDPARPDRMIIRDVFGRKLR
ncbi:MAG: hypothetical protein IAF08_09145 [Rhizobacter sp.]|nr:hypothetical protein [Chlorobiales bacterium]